MLHPLLNYIQRLRNQYGLTKYDIITEKGEKWMEEVAVETFNMTGQFEDVNVLGLEPYENLTNCTAAPYASYLLNKENVTSCKSADILPATPYNGVPRPSFAFFLLFS